MEWMEKCWKKKWEGEEKADEEEEWLEGGKRRSEKAGSNRMNRTELVC